MKIEKPRRRSGQMDWKAAHEMAINEHNETMEFLRERREAAASYQRQRDSFQREAREHQDLAELRRREIEALTASRNDLAEQLARRTADYDLVAMLIARCLK